MSERGSLTGIAVRMIGLALLLFLLITFLEDRAARASKDGLLAALFGPVSVVAWFVLTIRFVVRARPYARGLWSPFLLVGWAVLLGVASGFVGAFAGWEMYQLGVGAPESYGGGPGIPLPDYWYGDRDGLIRWPIVGGVICGFVAVVTSAADLMRGPQEPRQ